MEYLTEKINDLADSLNSKIPACALFNGSVHHKTLLEIDNVLKKPDNNFASIRTLESLRVTVRSTLELSEYLWSI